MVGSCQIWKWDVVSCQNWQLLPSCQRWQDVHTIAGYQIGKFYQHQNWILNIPEKSASWPSVIKYFFPWPLWSTYPYNFLCFIIMSQFFQWRCPDSIFHRGHKAYMKNLVLPFPLSLLSLFLFLPSLFSLSSLFPLNSPFSSSTHLLPACLKGWSWMKTLALKFPEWTQNSRKFIHVFTFTDNLTQFPQQQTMKKFVVN